MISNVEYHIALGVSTLIVLKTLKKLKFSKSFFFKEHTFVKKKNYFSNMEFSEFVFLTLKCWLWYINYVHLSNIGDDLSNDFVMTI